MEGEVFFVCWVLPASYLLLITNYSIYLSFSALLYEVGFDFGYAGYTY
jgi:hypothetical protein